MALTAILCVAAWVAAAEPVAAPPDREQRAAARHQQRLEDFRKRQGMVERAGLSRGVLMDASSQGMGWSEEAVIYLGPILDEASAAVRKLHESNPSLNADMGGGGSMTNLEEFLRAVTFTEGDDGRFARGCKSHQLTTFVALRDYGNGNDAHSPLEIHRLRVQRTGFTHNAVIVFPKGTDWKRTGIVLDGWIRQSHLPDEMTYLFPKWYGKLDFAARLLPDDD